MYLNDVLLLSCILINIDTLLSGRDCQVQPSFNSEGHKIPQFIIVSLLVEIGFNNSHDQKYVKITCTGLRKLYIARLSIRREL